MPKSELRDLSGTERAQLERQLLASRHRAAADGAIRPRLAGEVAPLSFAQQRLWFLHRLLPSPSLYNVGYTIRLQNALDESALGRAIEALVARHEALRTRFELSDGRPIQRILQVGDVHLEVDDVSSLPALQRDEHARSLAALERLAPFDLEHGPLLRTRLLRLGQCEHWLLLTLHHIVMDGWSMGVLWSELAALYSAFCRGAPSLLPPLPIQYADYAVWQQQWLSGDRLARGLAYWRDELSGMPALELPTDRGRPAVASYRGERVDFQLPEPLTHALRALAQRERATLFMVLLAGFQVLLSRHSGQDDFGIGVPTAGRTRPELEGLVGFFVNTLVLRARLQGRLSFREHLRRVRDVAIAAYDHQELPFEKLVEDLNPPRELSRNPLFQVSFALHDSPEVTLQLPGLEARPVDGIGQESAKFDLSLSLTEISERLIGSIEYSTDLFDRVRIERMVEHYQMLLDSAVAQPECSVAHLPMLTETERTQLLVDWNATAREYPREKCVHQLFQEQVQRRPDAIAVVWSGQQLTYRQLDARANQLANHLRGLGVGPDALVGVYLERSTELLLGLLAILKAGGAYLPLDPRYPTQRLEFMLRDAAASVLLTQRTLLDQLPTYTGRVLCMDRDSKQIGAHPITAPKNLATPENLAYVIYTSGSTGQPKGVAISHRNVVRLIFGVDYVHFGEEQTFLLLAPTAFDASTFEIWGSLLHGSRCVIYPDAVPSASGLEALIARHGVTTVWLTASLFNAVIDEKPDALRRVRQLLTGGEALSARHVRSALASLPDTELVNGYGPTESTTFACCYRIPRSMPADCLSVPIGRPIANTVLYVLDQFGEPVPIGVDGELYIGGDGLARGYWNRPELTIERFVPDPFGTLPGARLYRTGDRVRYRSDGNLEFLGRFDHQVKLRGFRIELGEIEAVLRQQPCIREAAVLRREDTPGNPRLVAYVVTKGDGLDAADLREALRRRLPDYMLPAAFVQLPSLPLTSNGKVDTRALPEPKHDKDAAEADELVGPNDAIQVQVMRIWEQALKRYPIGANEDFFDLGGHSLLAAQVVDRINRLFDRQLPIDVLWHGGRTVRALAALVRGRLGAAGHIWSRAVAFRAEGSRSPVFCPPVAGGHLYYYDNLARHLSPQQPIYGLPARGTDTREPPDTSIENMAAHAIRLMREVQPHGPYSLLGYCSAGVVAFEMAQQLAAGGESVARLILVDSEVPVRNPHALARQLITAARSGTPRLLQERIYQIVLNRLGLERLRKLQKPGEAHRWALWSYRPRALTVPMLLIRPSELDHDGDPTLGWRRYARGGIEVRTLDGAHGSLVTVRGAARLALEVEKWLG